MYTVLRSEIFDQWLASLQDERGKLVYLHLLGGEKKRQKRDIKRALTMARSL